jgi:hypothetical protein
MGSAQSQCNWWSGGFDHDDIAVDARAIFITKPLACSCAKIKNGRSLMEFLIMVCSATLQDEIDMLFEELRITSYTHILEATGAGEGGGIRLNNEVWPGENSMYLVSASPEQTAKIKEWVRTYRKKEIREGLKLFSLPLNEVI